MARMRRTKIIATLGPKSANPQMVKGLASVGVSVFRLNCSHLGTEELRANIAIVRKAAPGAGVLVDIQGPKMRFGGSDVELKQGAEFDMALSDLGIEHAASCAEVGLESGHRVLFDDGRIQTRVTDTDGGTLSVRVEKGGRLARGRGVNLPDTVVRGGVLSDKDLADIAVAREAQVEIVAVSFVQEPADVVAVRDLVGPDQMVFAKIERPQALESIDAICAVSDGVMAARGDLGVELPYEQVPSAQRAIAMAALTSGVASICATEMLESMIHSTRPTRAEVSDVSTAVRDGFDAVMLSAETAIGIDPVGAVRAMGRICDAAERDVSMPNWFADANPLKAAVTAAAAALAKRTGADRILSITHSGYSAGLLAACRPGSPIVAVTPTLDVARRLSVRRGVYSVVAEREDDIAAAIETALVRARQEGYVASGQQVVVCVSRLSPQSDADTIMLHLEP